MSNIQIPGTIVWPEKKLFDLTTGREWGWLRIIDDPNHPQGVIVQARHIMSENWQDLLSVAVMGDRLAYAIHKDREKPTHAASPIETDGR